HGGRRAARTGPVRRGHRHHGSPWPADHHPAQYQRLMAGQWMAAAAVAVVTPPPGLPMAGYAARDGVSAGALDDLEVNILTLRGPSGDRLAWIAIDALAVTAPLRAALTS